MREAPLGKVRMTAARETPGYAPAEASLSTHDATVALERLLAESGRMAVTRREVCRLGLTDGQCDRVLRKLVASGRIRRYGAGIYGVGNAKVFEVAAQALEALGYTVLPGREVRGYSERFNGAVLRLDRRCRRRIRGRGVRIRFESPSGRLMPAKRAMVTDTREFPARSETEEHFESFEHCHSLARAEKDLCVRKALEAIEGFRSPRFRLAIDGGTALSVYWRLLRRFSEDIDLRIVLPVERIAPHRPRIEDPERVESAKAAGAEFFAGIVEALPWLKPTRKGRVRRDGLSQSLICDYEGSFFASGVRHGIKFELAEIPPELATPYRIRSGNAGMDAVVPVEIAAGKWRALGRGIPRDRPYPDLIRHAHDLAELVGALLPSSDTLEALRRMVLGTAGLSVEGIRATLAKLERDDRFRERYESYMERMGTAPISDERLCHPTWPKVLAEIRTLAEAAGLDREAPGHA